VYVFFYNAANVQVGERVQDDIRYDPTPPTLSSASLRRISPTHVELRLRAKDAVSGLARIEVRHGPKLIVRRPRFAQRLRMPLKRTTRAVRVTVYDRAGNKSTKTARQNPRRSSR
jgi:hypothetical protein